MTVDSQGGACYRRLILGSYRHFVGLSFAGLCAISGCGNLIGLGGYSVADDHPDSGGTGGTENVAGGNVAGSTGGSDVMGDGGTGGVPDDNGGSAGEAGSAEAGAAGAAGGSPTCPTGCDDSNDCTADSCVSGACQHDPLAVGAACGVARSCDAAGLCVRCRDTAPGSGQDAGCSATAPICLGTGLDAACTGCSTAADCNDGNECTTETCSSGKCAFAAVAAGSACATGVCNGVAMAEKCVACADTSSGSTQDAGCTSAKPVCDVSSGTATCYECNTSSDCATDNVSCTVETCSNHTCSHVATDSLCTPSGDVCKPNKCNATLDCKQVDISAARTLIGLGSTQGNGGFEQPSGNGAAGWTDIGGFTMIFSCEPSGNGCAGANGTTFTQASGGSYLAWLGGTMSASTTGIDHLIVLPPGTVKLQLLADTNFQTKGSASSNKDSFEARLLDSSKAQVGAALYSANNTTAQTGMLRNWTVNGINVTVDVSAYVAAHPGADSYLSLWSNVDASLRTDFFIDNVRVTATVCQ